MEKLEKQTMKWYIVRTQGNREKSVLERLTKDSQTGELIGKIGRIVMPMEKKVYMKEGKKIVREKVIFPGYIFIETNSIGELKHYIKECKGASGFLTTRSGEIQVLKIDEVEKMIGKQQEDQEKESANVFYPDQKVKILEGPFAGFRGIIDTIKDQKVKVIVSIFERKTPVELNVTQIEKSVEDND